MRRKIMMQNDLDRRNFLKLGLAAGATATISMGFPKFSMANIKSTELSDCMEMNPEDIAKNSRMVMDSWKYIQDLTASIQDAKTREIVQGVLRHPAPTFMENLMDEKNKKETYKTLTHAGMTENLPFESFLPDTVNPFKSALPFIAGPGSGYSSHHAYPGGLVTHTALNAMVSMSILEGYKNTYGFALDRDTVIASQLLHDLHKPWVFQWQKNGESRTEKKLAGTGEHHTYSIAESIYRGLPSHICVAQACAHNHPGWDKDEKGPVDWISAAAILTGKDPVNMNLLSKDKKTLPVPRRMENFICHLGDHDWILSVPAAKWIIPLMKEIAVEKYKIPEKEINGKKFNQLRNYVFAQASIMNLYEIYSRRGKDALTYTVLSIVSPS